MAAFKTAFGQKVNCLTKWTLSDLLSWFPSLAQLFRADTPEEFDDFLEQHFADCVRRMEAEAHHLAADNEEKLSAFLAAALSMPGLNVKREAYSNGCVDLTIANQKVINADERLVEAKIFNGYGRHVGALNQLLARYSTGRHPTGYVIEYVKKAGIAGLVKELRRRSDEELPERQSGATKDHPTKWTYLSDHYHASEEVVRVVHMSVNLHRRS